MAIDHIPDQPVTVADTPPNQAPIRSSARVRESSPKWKTELVKDSPQPVAPIPQSRNEVELLRSARPALQPLPANRLETDKPHEPQFPKINHPVLAELLSSPPPSQQSALKNSSAKPLENVRFESQHAVSVPLTTSAPSVLNVAQPADLDKIKDNVRSKEPALPKQGPTTQVAPNQPRTVPIHDLVSRPTASAKTKQLPPMDYAMAAAPGNTVSQPSMAGRSHEMRQTNRAASQPLDGGDNPSSNGPSALTRSHQKHHQHSSSLPVSLPPSTQGFEPPRSSTPAVVQSQPTQLKNTHHDSNDKRSLALLKAPSEETILLTPSSLGQTPSLFPTTSRQSTTPSVQSQTTKKGFLKRFRRSSTPAPVHQYQVWHPNPSTSTPEGSPRNRRRPESPEPEERVTPAETPPNLRKPINISIPVRNQVPSPHPQVFNPFDYLTQTKHYGVDSASMQARDGMAVSLYITVIVPGANLNLEHCHWVPNCFPIKCNCSSASAK